MEAELQENLLRELAILNNDYSWLKSGMVLINLVYFEARKKPGLNVSYSKRPICSICQNLFNHAFCKCRSDV